MHFFTYAASAGIFVAEVKEERMKGDKSTYAGALLYAKVTALNSGTTHVFVGWEQKNYDNFHVD